MKSPFLVAFGAARLPAAASAIHSQTPPTLPNR